MSLSFNTVRTALTAAIICISAFALSAPAESARRLALVIGADNYHAIPRLETAVGDARAMAETLGKLGFAVTLVLNPDRRGFNRAVASFTRQLEQGDTAAIHFSGHGVEIRGQNYLLPVDAPKPAAGDVEFVRSEAIGMNHLLRQVERAGARTRLFIIDACRDNPFARSGVRSIGGTRGLSRIEAPAGTFIMYSAGYRQRALDRLNDDDPAATSVYTRVLIKELQEPGKTISDVARAVRGKVEKLARSVGHVQRPAYYDELSDRLVLVPAAQVTEPDRPDTGAGLHLELAYWNTVKNRNDPQLLKAYLKQYPKGTFASLAKTMLADIPVEKDPAAAPQEKAQDVLQQDPAKRSGKDLIRAVQAELARHNCNPGPADGVWGRGSKRAAGLFLKAAGLGLSPTPNEDLLKALKQAKAPNCARIAARPPGNTPPKTERTRQSTKKTVTKRKKPATRKQSGKSKPCGVCQNIRVCGHRYLTAYSEGLCF